MRQNRANNAAARRIRDSEGNQDCGLLAGIYFVWCDGFVKIGISADVIRRLRSIRSCNPSEVFPLAFIHEPVPIRMEALEIELHNKFGWSRHRLEWFRFTADIEAYIRDHTQAWPTEFMPTESYYPRETALSA